MSSSASLPRGRPSTASSFSFRPREKKASVDISSKFKIITTNHNHYDFPPKKQNIVYINLKVRKLYRDSDVMTANAYSYALRVECNNPNNVWIIRRNVADFKTLDHTLHGGCAGIESCRAERGLPPLHPPETIDKGHNSYSAVYLQYSNYLDNLNKFLDSRSKENGNLVLLEYFVCSLLLNWFEISLEGLHKIYVPTSPMQGFNLGGPRNAIVKLRFPKQALGDLTLEVNDIVTVVENVVAQDSAWARGKSDKTFLSGVFPECCVEDFNFDNTQKPDLSKCPGLEFIVNQGSSTRDVGSTNHEMKPKPALPASVTRKDASGQAVTEKLEVPPVFGGTLADAMKWNNALKERKLSCVRADLAVLYTAEFCEVSLVHVPWFIQEMVGYLHLYGTVDGIYRLSGSSSEILNIISMIDSGINHIDFSCFDTHSVSSALKQFFRDLSAPLIPVDDYDSFMEPFQKYPDLVQQKSNSRSDVINSEKVSKVDEKELNCALDEIQDCLYRLPFSHYHTLKLLMLHLKHLVSKSNVTSMGLYNLAIMWAPNLLFDPKEKQCTDFIAIATRAKETAAKKGKLLELLIDHAPVLFNDHLPKSILQKINAMGCRDKLRGSPVFEPEEFEVIEKSGANSFNQMLTLPRSFTSGEKGLIRTLRGLFSPNKAEYNVKKAQSVRERSASVIGNVEFARSELPRDDFSVESGMYSYIIPQERQSYSVENYNLDHSALNPPISPVRPVLKSDDSPSECGSDDSTIGQFTDDVNRRRDRKILESQESKLNDDPQSHVYSRIRKNASTYASEASNMCSVTTEDESQFLREFNRGALLRGDELGDDIPFIDSPAPAPTTSSTPTRSRIAHKFTSKESMLSPGSRKASTPILSSNQYNYSAGQTLDNYSSDRAFLPAKPGAAAPNANSAYRRYFSSASATHSRSNTSHAATKSECDQNSVYSPEIIKRPLGESCSINGNNHGKYSTNCSFDSGVENNASSNDEL